MIIYHGSYLEVESPDIVHSRPRVDFGRGFYVTPIREQAENWCGKFLRQGKAGVVNQYEFSEEKLAKFQVLHFEKYSEEWLDFILNCRRGKDMSEFDFVSGGVANDKVFNTIELYFDGLIEKQEALKRLQYEHPNLQYCFRSQELIDQSLKFVGSEKI